MFNFLKRFKGTGDITEKDIPILRELDLLDNCGVIVFGITYANFAKMNNKTSIEPSNEVQITKKMVKEYNKAMKDDMRGRIELKKYMDRTSGGK